MSSKQGGRDDKNRVNKRPQKSAPKASRPSEPSIRYVYLATVEVYGPYLDTEQEIFEVYETLADANKRLRTYQQRLISAGKTHRSHYEAWESHGVSHEGWKDSIDGHGCWHSVMEDEDRNGERYHVKRMLLRSKGSVPPPPPLSEEDSPVEVFAEGDDPEEILWGRF